MKAINILGTRGIPAAHGGFESFVAQFAPFMLENGWDVTVYCQASEGVRSPKKWIDEWHGIRRIHFETRLRGALSTIEFDLRSTLHVLRDPGIDLVLGYNTAIFILLQRLAKRQVITNMDGIEWKRKKWGKFSKIWFWLNEWIGSRFSSKIIADHPEIARHLLSRGCHGVTVIPYGSEPLTNCPLEYLSRFGIEPSDYFISIARIEPENSILEMVNAFVSTGVGRKFIVLGRLQPEINSYHARVKQAANSQVIFPGAIYDQQVVQSLRYHCLAYMHGHQVGGTNPSLVEALGAGNAVIAHDNPFNRWTAGTSQLFFSTVDECAALMKYVSENTEKLALFRSEAIARHRQSFEYELIHNAYLEVINSKTEATKTHR